MDIEITLNGGLDEMNPRQVRNAAKALSELCRLRGEADEQGQAEWWYNMAVRFSRCSSMRLPKPKE